MKSNSTYIIAFLSLLLFVNCTEKEKKKTLDTTNTEIETETESMLQDSIADISLEELEADKKSIPHHYICYTNDDKSSMQLSIAFNATSNALFVKYEGQEDSIPLENVKEDFQSDGAYPTITQFYDEMLNGKKNGTYELTHSGNWDYVKYRSLEGDKVVKFTINHDATIVDGEYRKTPCFGDSE
ncbi:hypothetical protein IMCC3317_22190 [Kordia antarctica]|uniref:Uncharacterized protein n=1 Tax=Kordia antarctica TaxID=1218801 RepID=A0A7L4ZK92_9FLAO|nr:hypothetical protein [Kordia antarctica]QHI36849.1 hypothetical protein IMCC3317_22190 [Kordia antarctica]